jgi:hypothetical protein
MIEMADQPIIKKVKKERKKKEKNSEELGSTDSDDEAKSFGRRDSQSSIASGEMLFRQREKSRYYIPYIQGPSAGEANF